MYVCLLTVAVAGSVPADEVYEKAVNMATKVYQFNTERGVYETIHENSSHMIKIGLLDSKKVSAIARFIYYTCLNIRA